MDNILDNARRLRDIVEQATVSLDDKTASEGPTLFPRLRQDGGLIKAGTRIYWQGQLKKANVDMWDCAENTPDAAPTLWADIAYRDGLRIIPETITAEQAFALDEVGWWGDEKYKSLMHGNVFTPPGDYPQAWVIVAEG